MAQIVCFHYPHARPTVLPAHYRRVVLPCVQCKGDRRLEIVAWRQPVALNLRSIRRVNPIVINGTKRTAFESSSVGFGRAPGTPKGMSEGPIARMITLIVLTLPVAIIPAMRTLSPLNTRRRVEMFPPCQVWV